MDEAKKHEMIEAANRVSRSLQEIERSLASSMQLESYGKFMVAAEQITNARFALMNFISSVQSER